MKILHVLGATEDNGGILTVLRNLDEVAGVLGCEHVVWVNSIYRETRSPSLHYRRSRHLLGEAANPWQLLIGAVRAVPELRRLAAQEQPEVVHLHSRGALPLLLFRAWCGPAPWLVTLHAYAKRVRLYRWVACNGGVATTVLTPRMALYYGLTPAGDRVKVVSECCSDRFFEVPLAGGLGSRAPNDPVRLVGLGSIIREKNWHLILEAVQRLEASDRHCLQFHHYGPTSPDKLGQTYARELAQLHQAAGLCRDCVFHGPTLAVKAVLRAADWFVLPSTNEPCSVALIEALALGLPALVSDSGGNPDIVSSGRTGLMFAPDDAEALADCLRRIIRGEPQVAGPAGIRESVRSRRASVVAAEYRALYARLVAPRTAVRPQSRPSSAEEDG